MEEPITNKTYITPISIHVSGILLLLTLFISILNENYLINNPTIMTALYVSIGIGGIITIYLMIKLIFKNVCDKLGLKYLQTNILFIYLFIITQTIAVALAVIVNGLWMALVLGFILIALPYSVQKYSWMITMKLWLLENDLVEEVEQEGDKNIE